MREIELSVGTVEYEDTGGDGPVLVMLHGLMMDASLWDGPIAGLSSGHRCVAPTVAASARGGLLVATAERLPEFKHPALVVWASEDRVMPPEHGGRLAALLPGGRLVEVEDSYTLIPLDQPARLAAIIREFTSAR